MQSNIKKTMVSQLLHYYFIICRLSLYLGRLVNDKIIMQNAKRIIHCHVAASCDLRFCKDTQSSVFV
jgi:hypothetical protein